MGVCRASNGHGRCFGKCIQTGRATQTQLKRELMEHFQEHGMQKQSDGKHIIFVFPEGMYSLLGNISLPFRLILKLCSWLE